MAIAFRDKVGRTSATSAAVTTITIPATVQATDSLFAVASFSGTTQTLTVPSGWNVVSGPVDKGTSMRHYLLNRVADNTDAGSSVNFDWTAITAYRNTTIVILSGVDTANPIYAFASKVETTAGTTHTSPTVTAAGSGCWVVEFCADRGSPSSTTFSVSTGQTVQDQQIGTGGGSVSLAVSDSEGPVSPGTVGGETWTGDLNTANAILWTLAVQPLQVTPTWTYGYDVVIG